MPHTEPYPLTSLQEGLLFHALLEDPHGAYLQQFSCRLTGALDVPGFRAAWDRVVARHAALRTAFRWEGLPQPVQVPAARVQLPWIVEDWSAEADPVRRLDEHLRADLARPFDLTVAPLLRLALFRVSADQHLFTWSHHHIVLDGWSFSTVLREVIECHRDGRAPERPATQFRDHVAWLARRDADGDRAFWRRYLAGVREPTPVPGLLPPRGEWPPGREPSAGGEPPRDRQSTGPGGSGGGALRRGLTEHRELLDTGTVRRLEDWARTERVTPAPVAVAAWGAPLAAAAGPGRSPSRSRRGARRPSRPCSGRRRRPAPAGP